MSTRILLALLGCASTLQLTAAYVTTTGPCPTNTPPAGATKVAYHGISELLKAIFFQIVLTWQISLGLRLDVAPMYVKLHKTHQARQLTHV
jgi:hypothetical protein